MNREKQNPIKKITSRRPPMAFLVCLLLATFTWLSIHLSKEYTQTLSYKITCYDIPENVDEVSLSDSTMYITIRTKGFNFIKPSFSDKRREIKFSIQELTKSKGTRRAYSYDKSILEEYIREKEIFGNGFIAIDHPERFTFYLK